MKVLFVSAGGKDELPKNIVRNQGISLERLGIEIKYFCVKGNGIRSYISSLPRLRKELKSYRPDIVHAHYSFSGFLASLSGAYPLVVSLMGSDANKSFIFRFITRIFIKFSWNLAIVKSSEMKEKLKIKNAFILPNGVDTELFTNNDKKESSLRSGMDLTKRNILFVADTGRPEKNFSLAKKAVGLLNDHQATLIAVKDVPNPELSSYYNAADLLLMTSLWEGSPNVVKEAMACSLPVVSTAVGDVAELLRGVDGCYICSFDPADVAEKIEYALEFGKKTNGREKIFNAGLDSATIARRLEEEYSKLIN